MILLTIIQKTALIDWAEQMGIGIPSNALPVWNFYHYWYGWGLHRLDETFDISR